MIFTKTISTAESDDVLIQRYKLHNDINALGQLYSRYLDLVYGVCLKYMKQPEEAKDCVLNIFEELVVKLKKYEVEIFKGWLYQLTKNYCLMKLRSDKKYPSIVSADIMHLNENFHLDEVKEKEMQLNQMEYCIEKLPERQKEAIQLFYLQGKCYKEIAGIINEEVNQVRSYIQNARRNLKICMEKENIKIEMLNGRK